MKGWWWINLISIKVAGHLKRSTFRADNEGLSEQKRLEGLITRYKSMIPVIESTMAKIDVYTKSYAFRGEVKKVRITFALIWMKTQSDWKSSFRDASFASLIICLINC